MKELITFFGSTFQSKSWLLNDLGHGTKFFLVRQTYGNSIFLWLKNETDKYMIINNQFPSL